MYQQSDIVTVSIMQNTVGYTNAYVEVPFASHSIDTIVTGSLDPLCMYYPLGLYTRGAINV